MANFDSDVNIKPTYGVQKKSSPKNIEVQFGDGYISKNAFGLNQNPKVYQLTFEVSETDADIIETFLDTRAKNSDSFTFTPPGESSSSQFFCKSWNKSMPYLNRARIQATFEEVFQP